MTDHDKELHDLIAIARHSDAPSAAQLSAGKAALMSKLDAGAAAAAGSQAAVQGGTAAATGGAATTSVALVGVIAAAVIAVGVGLGVWMSTASTARQAGSAPRTSMTEPSQPAVTTPSAPTAVEAEDVVAPAVTRALDAAPETSGSKAAAKRPLAKRSIAREQPATDDFAAEVALLRQAVEAERDGHLDEARALLRAHVERYPNSQLAHERTRLQTRIDGTSQ